MFDLFTYWEVFSLNIITIIVVAGSTSSQHITILIPCFSFHDFVGHDRRVPKVGFRLIEYYATTICKKGVR